jgi:hypothetical protein
MRMNKVKSVLLFQMKYKSVFLIFASNTFFIPKDIESAKVLLQLY